MHKNGNDSCIDDEMAHLKAFLSQHLHADEPTVNAMCQHVGQRGGKHIRAKLVLWTAKHFSPDHTSSAIRLAAIVELLHAATLLHDDVIDQAEMRRHAPATHQIWDNKCAILGGDYLYGIAFQEIARLQHNAICQTIADATTQIISGEVRQLMACKQPHYDLSTYFRTIQDKTAQLFEVSTQTAAMLHDASPADTADFKAFGHHLGMAFQMLDDLKDYFGDTDQLGKKVGNDFFEGKMTLPVLCALQNMPSHAQDAFKTTLQRRHRDDLQDVMVTMHAFNGAQDAFDHCCQHITAAEAALATQSDDPYVKAMRSQAQQLKTQAKTLLHQACRA